MINDLSNEIPLLPLIADQTQQVFVNILLNAVDAISEKRRESKELELKGPGFGLPPEGASILFPPCGSLLE